MITSEQHIYMTRVELISFDLSPGLFAYPRPQSVLVTHVLASPDRISNAFRKWLWNLISPAIVVLVTIIGSKPVLSSTTPPVIMLYSSSSSSSSSTTVVVLLELLELVELLLFVELLSDELLLAGVGSGVGSGGGADGLAVYDWTVGTELVFLLVFTFTSKRGAPRLMLLVANYLVYFFLITFRSSVVWFKLLSGSIS